MNRETHTFDAKGKVLGRLATKIATLLQGKHKPTYAPHKDCGDTVVVKNPAQIHLSGKKKKRKKYYHHSGYPGGLKETEFKELLDERPQEVIKRAVWNMLPKNKLRQQRIKRLKFEL